MAAVVLAVWKSALLGLEFRPSVSVRATLLGR